MFLSNKTLNTGIDDIEVSKKPNINIVKTGKILKFNKEYYEPIKSGKKTQTLRKNNKRLQENEIVKAIFPGTDNEIKIKIRKL